MKLEFDTVFSILNEGVTINLFSLTVRKSIPYFTIFYRCMFLIDMLVYIRQLVFHGSALSVVVPR